MPHLKWLWEEVLSRWQARHSDVLVLTQQNAFQIHLEAFANQQHTLLDKLVKGVISNEVEQTTNRELDAEIAINRAQIHDTERDALDITGILNAADFMLSNLANI